MTVMYFDMDAIRVYQRDNIRGNPRLTIEIFGTEVLHAEVGALQAHPDWEHLFTEDDPEQVDTEMVREMVQSALATHLSGVLVSSSMQLWGMFKPHDDRGFWRSPPRVEVLEDDEE